MSDTNSPISTTMKVPRGQPRSWKNALATTFPSEGERVARAHLKTARSASTKAFNKACRANALVAECIKNLATANRLEADRVVANANRLETERLFKNIMHTDTATLGTTVTVETTEGVAGLAFYDSGEDEDSDVGGGSDGPDTTDGTTDGPDTTDEAMVEFETDVSMQTTVQTAAEMQAV